MKTETVADRKAKGSIPRELRAVGAMIKKERNSQKLSLAELSDKAYGNPHAATMISKIERAMKPQVSFMTIVALMKALEIPVI
jgi:transcriptional regulator with XRE-family HTH domain